MGRVFDCTIFSQDFRVLEIRLKELWEAVDVFVVCESNFTHAGEKKEMYLSNDSGFIEKFKEKLVVIRHVVRKPHKNPRIQEMQQREALTSYFKDIGIGYADVISHSDCDEIPRPEIFSIARAPKSNLLLELDNFTYYLNLRKGIYRRGRIVSGDLFKGIQSMRQDIFKFDLLETRKLPIKLGRIPDFWAKNRWERSLPTIITPPKAMRVIQNAGWHFNNLLTSDEISKKIRWSSHVELNTKSRHTIENIEKMKQNRADVYFGEKFEVDSNFQNLPRYIQEHVEDWRDFLILDE